jgi:hypothetical protein
LRQIPANSRIFNFKLDRRKVFSGRLAALLRRFSLLGSLAVRFRQSHNGEWNTIRRRSIDEGRLTSLKGKTMRRYHHIGIPTTEVKPGETHLKHLKLFVVSHEKSEFGVEWMRFEADAAVPDLVRQVPLVAFEVADLASELAGREILIPPNSPSDGVRVAFIAENGAPIELLEFTDPNHPARRQ